MTDAPTAPGLPSCVKDGTEAFHSMGRPLQRPSLTLRDFWSWAFSDLTSNALRGLVAEYLVARAVSSEQRTRVEWNAYDVVTPDGIRIEVKASGYLQSWPQRGLSVVSFDIARKRSWYASDNTYSAEASRPAQVYVFAVHHHQDKVSMDPLDVTQWSFYVLATTVLDQHCPTQSTIRLSALVRLGAVHVPLDDVAAAVQKAAGNGRRAPDRISCP